MEEKHNLVNIGQQSRYRKCPVFCFDQFWYFGHNLLNFDPILVIQISGYNRLLGEQFI